MFTIHIKSNPLISASLREMKKILIICILCNQIFISCKSQSQQGEVVKILIKKAREYVEDSTNGNIINLKTATSFKWDTLYKIGELVSDESIGNWIGIKNYKSLLHEGGTHEDYFRMIFTYKHNVVHEEEFNDLENNQEYVFNLFMPIDTTSDVVGKDTTLHDNQMKYLTGCYLNSKFYATADESIFILYFGTNWEKAHKHRNDKGFQKFFGFALARDIGRCVVNMY